MKTVFCYGDSNTYGYDPRSFLGDRYEKEVRWCDRLEVLSGWRVLNFGENGRCIPNSDYALSILNRQLREAGPLQQILLFLGTNDLLMGRSPMRVCRDMENLVLELQHALPGVPILLLAPPSIYLPEPGLQEARKELADLYESLGARLGLGYLNTAGLSLGCDGIHLSPEGHEQLARILALTLS